MYIHTNKVNQKVYIGITGRKPSERWQNGNGYKLNPYFWNAIQKYGWDGFEHEIIEDNLTRKEAEQKEIYYIKKYDSTNHSKGYNIQRGGNLSYRPTVKQYDRVTGKFIKEWDCTISAEQELNIPNANISAVCTGKVKTAHGFYFTYEDLGEQLPEHIFTWINTNDWLIPIVQYDLDGNFIKKYDTIQEASKQFSGKSKINFNCKSSFGYIWKVIDKENPIYPLKLSQEEIEKSKPNYHSKAILQYSLDGEYIRKFNNVQEIVDLLNCNMSNIAATCRKEYFQSNGYIWRYENDGYECGVNLPKEETIFIYGGSISVYQYDLKGQLIKKYNSITEAANENNMATTNISKACNGTIKTANSCIWRYEDTSFSDEDLKEILHNNRKRKIIQYDKDNNYINTYESIAEAMRQTGVRDTSISNCCRGKYRFAGGYKWEYAS